MMTSSTGNIFRVTGHLCGEFTGPLWLRHKGQWRGALMFSLICVWINDWVHNHEAADLRRYRAYDVIIMLNRGYEIKWQLRVCDAEPPFSNITHTKKPRWGVLCWNPRYSVDLLTHKLKYDILFFFLLHYDTAITRSISPVRAGYVVSFMYSTSYLDSS